MPNQNFKKEHSGRINDEKPKIYKEFSKLREKVKILEKLEIEREHEPQSTKKSSVLERAKIFTTISR